MTTCSISERATKMTEIEPGHSLGIVGGVKGQGYPLNSRIEFVKPLVCRRLHAVWLGRINGSAECLVKLSRYLEKGDKEYWKALVFSRESSLHDTTDEILWRNGYGVFYDSILIGASPEAKGLEMIPDEWCLRGTERDLSNEILEWQATAMRRFPTLFPSEAGCYILEDGSRCLVYRYLEADNLRATMHANPKAVPEILLKLALKLHLLETTWGPHQDLKPEHVLVTSGGDVRLLDPGFRRFGQEDQVDYPSVSFITTPRYYPLLRYSLHDSQALAVIIYEWLTGLHPFNGTFWDGFPKTLDKGKGFREDELWLSRMRFIKSMPRCSDKISKFWWDLMLDLFRLRISLEDASIRILDMLHATPGGQR